MQLELKIRRQGGTEVVMPNAEGEAPTTYHFKPLDPTRADSPHVCEVSNDDHLQRFIAAAPESYVLFRGAAAPKLDAPKAPAPAMPTAATLPAEAAADKAADNDVDTNNDGRITVAELAEGIAAGKYTQEQLRELLAAEEATGEPRKGFVKAITHALK